MPLVKKIHRKTGYRYRYSTEEQPIRGFSGEYRFLSNFYPAEVPMWGNVFPTSEHAYTFFKSPNTSFRLDVLRVKKPGLVKKLGRCVDLAPDWGEKKFKVMLTVVLRKFMHNEELRERLLATGLAYLEEMNTWDDRIWGVCDGEGQNHLGKILMCVRTILQRKAGRGRRMKWKEYRKTYKQNPKIN